MPAYANFNPRTREGCDDDDLAPWNYFSKISIHAPVKGATEMKASSHRLTPTNFNPRTREGCDVTDEESFELYCYFNPRTREGCDNDQFKKACNIFDFNPRTREGCDLNTRFCGAYDAIISIHAPVKGATLRHIKKGKNG